MPVFIAMNRFQVVSGRGEDFERIWRERDTYLDGIPAFIRFALLRGQGGEYVSHSMWASRVAFDAWTNSDSFRKSHAQGSLTGILAGPPAIALYDAVLQQEAKP
jgi:heme-degrading monooxygenase HmoA